MPSSRRLDRLALTLAGVCLIQAGLLPDAIPAPGSGAERSVRIVLDDPGSLPPDLAEAIPLLMAEALESGGVRVATAGGGDPDGEVSLSVSGKGPWKLAGRSSPLRPGGLPRASSRKVGLSGADDLDRALDQIASELTTSWKRELPELAGAPAVAPLREWISPVARARGAFAKGRAAIAAGRAADARRYFDEALAADPACVAAAVEGAALDLAWGDRPARPIPSRPVPGRLAAAAKAFEAHSRKDPQGALAILDQAGPAGAMGWRAGAAGGLALAMLGRHAEAIDRLQASAQSAPGDPRLEFWLGSARMGSGDMTGAAGSFARARSSWPEHSALFAYQAEALARARETEASRQVLLEMKKAESRPEGAPQADGMSADLLLGSLDLMEGRWDSALKQFERALESSLAGGAARGTIERLHVTVVDMRRERIGSRDPLARKRQVEDALDAVARYEAWLPPDERRRRECELIRLRGLVKVREGATVDGWKLVEEIRSRLGTEGCSPYDEAYLAGALMLREGDDRGARPQFEKAAGQRRDLPDLLDLAQVSTFLQEFDTARAALDMIAARIERYDPLASGTDGLFLSDPRAAATVPAFHYASARLAFLTGDASRSRHHFNRLLKYYRHPDEQFMSYVREAVGRGAIAE